MLLCPSWIAGFWDDARPRRHLYPHYLQCRRRRTSPAVRCSSRPASRRLHSCGRRGAGSSPAGLGEPDSRASSRLIHLSVEWLSGAERDWNDASSVLARATRSSRIRSFIEVGGGVCGRFGFSGNPSTLP